MIDISSLKPSINILPPKIIIYGTSKIGKSTFSAGAPNPIVLDLENGMESFNLTKYKVKAFSQVMEFLRSLYRQEHDYKYLIVDSIDWLEKMMISELCKQYNATNLADKNCRDFLYGGAERLLLQMWNQFIVGLDFLHQEKGMGIILIAHPQIKKFEDPLTSSYDQYSIKLEKRSGERLKEWVDCILFATLKVKTEKEKQGFGSVVNRGMGSDRVIYTEKRPSFEAGNRFKLPFEIPLIWNAFNENYNRYVSSLQKSIPVSPKCEAPLQISNQAEEVLQIEGREINSSGCITELQANFIKRVVTPERLLQILRDHNLSRLEEMKVKDYHDVLRFEALNEFKRTETETEEQAA